VPVLTVIVEVPPASAMGVSTETVGTGASSSSVMVPVAVASEMVTVPLGAAPLRVTVKVSFCSSMMSERTGTMKVASVWPAAIVTEPLEAVKSAPTVAAVASADEDVA